MLELSKGLIERRIREFVGHGNLDSVVWFVGIEEGRGNDTIEQLNKRLHASDGKQTMDIQELDLLSHRQWFKENPPIQRTWRIPIRTLLVLEEKQADNNAIKEFQRKLWARADANHGMFELFPLPCRSTRNAAWPYGIFARDEETQYLASRQAYMKKVAPERIKLFKTLIAEYKPKLVIFYAKSKKYRKCWQEIVGNPLEPRKICDSDELFVSNNGTTKFIVIPHPVARGISRERWNHIINFIKEYFTQGR